jgi:DNA-binding beta-propeller fold protein YncE
LLQSESPAYSGLYDTARQVTALTLQNLALKMLPLRMKDKMRRWATALMVALLATASTLDVSSAAQSGTPPPLRLQRSADIPLEGHSTRLDYESLDAARHLLFIAHLGDSEVIVIDTQARRLIKRIADVSKVHGVLAIPELGRVYASATGTNEVVAIDETTFKIIARMPGGTYPDGLAYGPETHKVYVSDEHGGTDTVIDVLTNTRVATVQIGGVIGNTQYDAVSHHMFINAQSTSELVEVDPATDKIVRRIKVPGADGNHGLLIDSVSHRAFIACEGNDRLIVIDIRSGAALGQFPVAKDPDVLAFDAQRQKLYVAGESGEVSEFSVASNAISKSGESFLARNAHVVAVEPSTHEVYFPLMNVDGKPVLRIMQPETD